MRSIWSLILLGSLITYHCLTTVSGEQSQESTEASHPTFESCKPYVDAALKTGSPAEGDDESGEDGTEEQTSSEDGGEPPDESVAGESEQDSNEEEQDDSKQNDESGEQDADEKSGEESENTESEENNTKETTEDTEEDDSKDDAAADDDDDSKEQASEENATEEEDKSAENEQTEEDVTQEENQDESTEEAATAEEDSQEGGDSSEDKQSAEDDDDSTEEKQSEEEDDSKEDKQSEEEDDSKEDKQSDNDDEPASTEESDGTQEESAEDDGGEKTSAEVEEEGSEQADSKEDEEAKTDEDDQSTDGNTEEDSGEEAKSDGSVSSDVADEADQSESGESEEDKATQEDQASAEDAGSPETETVVSEEEGQDSTESAEATSEGSEEAASEEEEEEEAEPYEPRSRDHLIQILGLDDSEETKTTFNLLDKATQSTLKELKSTYENAIKPLEQMYKYRDLSNRHFGDPEIFSKPLIVFMGPWSGGKSTIINWLLGIQHEEYALRTGADPSPAQFNIMMYGKEAEKLDGTQLAADWTFSGLQKFGQSFLDRLRGQKLPNRLLEKVNIVEIPGILEVRKQVERSFPFNDACQWFIDRADTLFLIYDPAKLDIGPETEAILDQLKGRENQVRIVLNKADTVKPDELMRVQAMLVWNISPLMSSAEPPVLYAASLWDRPLQVESPKSLLVAHENSFLKDIKDGVERRVETRIAAARRFAVRVRNHAKMVDCYLNTYNNHRSFFSDRKTVSSDIIDHPQNYHIYEGLSTLTNISRYDLPDPDTYRDFFRLNPIWDFPTLQSTCSFWRGCPLHKLDIAIAYDLPEILGKFRRQREAIVTAKSSSKK